MTEWRPPPWSPPAVHGAPPPEFLPEPPPPPAPPRRAWLVPVVAVAAVVVLVGAGLGLWFGLRGSPAAPEAGAAPSSSSAPDFPRTTAVSPVPTTAAPTTPTPTAPATVSPGGIQISAVSGDPHLAAVVTVFDTYFAGINAHDAGLALIVFDPAGVIDPGDPAQVAAFARDTATTHDDQARLDAIAVTATGLDVRVDFRSTQDPSLGPDGQACTLWSAVYHLTASGSRYLVHGSDAEHTAC